MGWLGCWTTRNHPQRTGATLSCNGDRRSVAGPYLTVVESRADDRADAIDSGDDGLLHECAPGAELRMSGTGDASLTRSYW
jgi:hypothetical protein